MKRCKWATEEPNITYHDKEWGRPQHDDQKLFEFLVLEGAQAGLSWITILKHRNGYKRHFLILMQKFQNILKNDISKVIAR